MFLTVVNSIERPHVPRHTGSVLGGGWSWSLSNYTNRRQIVSEKYYFRDSYKLSKFFVICLDPPWAILVDLDPKWTDLAIPKLIGEQWARYVVHHIKCPSSIWCRDLNSQPLEHESPITTRPGLPPMHKKPFCK